MPDYTVLKEISTRLANEVESGKIMYEIINFCHVDKDIDEIIKHVESKFDTESIVHGIKMCLSWLIDLKAVNFNHNHFTSTEEALLAISALTPTNRLRALFDASLEHKDIFLRLMKACVEPKTRSEIESLLDGAACGEYYPSYFTSELESAGALVWKNKGWLLTKEGSDLLLGELIKEGGESV